MNNDKFDKLLDYFPIIAYLGFWVQGAFFASIMTGEPRLVALGVVTIPALLALFLAIRRIRARHRGEG